MAVIDTLGLPNARGRGPLIVAQVVDALGTGLFLPFAVVYFHTDKGIALTTVGLMLSAAALLSLPAGPLAGPLIDWIGPRRVVVASNLVRVLTFTGYVFTDAPWQLVALVTVTLWGESQFRPAAASLVAQVADEGQRARWYAMERALRNVGIGTGGLLGGALVGWGGTGGYTAVVVLNAVSFHVAAVLVGTWRRSAEPAVGGPTPAAHGPAMPRAGYREVLADRAFLGVLVTVGVFALCDLALTVLLSAYVIDARGLPAWQPGTLFAINTVLVVLAQTLVARAVERRRRPRVLQTAAALWAVSFALFAAVPTGRPVVAFGALVIGMVVFTAAELLQAPTSSALTVAIAAERVRGRYLGLEELMWSLARVLAPTAFTWLLVRGPGLPWLALGLCCLAAVVVLARLDRVLPAHAVREPADA
ncbi:MFS transporter [Streptomyces scabiei]|uniref:MFS transporter n=1 Tax=Streptomyces scabiei TaxID=1930 RepID=UPI001B33EB10|nr:MULTISPECIES: MFS transporter [Streptomyces]MBP5888891.1 MFS transporter [Streptomyces sp. LBUM 1481]MBP5918911.1 MFS transporter [Streptomyces sp. LBUM 1483]MDX2685440.1 MFS transporter [Streptomyces scabiei]MDX2748624.1 MFS transporter [Streptomyces scabiei]MDX2803309.1 MFS transporter [Streptomyces scabiei]